MLYAPYSNVGQINLDRNEGYINIPEKNVIFTRLDDEHAEGVDARQEELNEGQKMVFDMQDALLNQHQISNANIMQPQLLDGYDLNEEKIKTKMQQDRLLTEIMDDKDQQEKLVKDKQASLYLERETDNLHSLIYQVHDENDEKNEA